MKRLQASFEKNGITLILSHVLDQPLSVMKKADFISTIGSGNICSNIDLALNQAKNIVGDA